MPVSSSTFLSAPKQAVRPGARTRRRPGPARRSARRRRRRSAWRAPRAGRRRRPRRARRRRGRDSRPRSRSPECSQLTCSGLSEDDDQLRWPVMPMRGVRPAVVAVAHREDLVGAPVVRGDQQRRLVGLGAGVGEEHPRRPGCRRPGRSSRRARPAGGSGRASRCARCPCRAGARPPRGSPGCRSRPCWSARRRRSRGRCARRRRSPAGPSRRRARSARRSRSASRPASRPCGGPTGHRSWPSRFHRAAPGTTSTL